MVLQFLYTVFIIACLFDPDNQILALKLPVFILIVIYTFISKKVKYPPSVLRYIMFFGVILPIISVMWGWLSNTSSYRDESLLDIIKPFLFIILSISLVNSPEIDIHSLFSRCLLLLAVVIIILFIVVVSGIVPEEILYAYGNSKGVFTVGERDFSSLTINRVYFHTSPMLVFGSFYFYNKYHLQNSRIYLFYTILISIALFLSGTRNDMIMSFAPFLVLGFINGTKKVKTMIVVATATFVLYLLSHEILEAMLDKEDTSNSTKLAYLADYSKRFGNILALVLGDGLGSYFLTADHGFVNNTELTYLELFRRFGLIMGCIYLYLILMPFKKLYNYQQTIWLSFAYLMYLVMVFSNPFFFSSNGMLILSIVIATLYNSKRNRGNYEFSEQYNF